MCVQDILNGSRPVCRDLFLLPDSSIEIWENSHAFPGRFFGLWNEGDAGKFCGWGLTWGVPVPTQAKEA